MVRAERYSKIVNATVRFGAVFRNQEFYRAARCCDTSYCYVRRDSPLNGFAKVRFGADFRNQESHGAARCCDTSYGSVPCDSPFNGFCLGAVPILLRRENRRKRLFSTVHRMNKPCKTAVLHGSQDFSRSTNETAVSRRCIV